MEVGFLEIIGFLFIAMTWGWNIVQVYVFFQDKFRPPEEKERFDGQKALMLQELYNDMNDKRDTYEYDAESGTIIRELQSQITALYAMHDCSDDNGVKLWYVPRGMRQDITSVLRILRDLRRANDIRDLRSRRSQILRPPTRWSSSDGGYESV